MKRALQEILIDELSKHLLAGMFAAGDTVHVDVKEGVLAFGKTAFPVGPTGAGSQRVETGKGKASEKEKTLADLAKATEDLNEAVEGVKKG